LVNLCNVVDKNDQKYILISFAEDVEFHFISKTDIRFYGFCLTFLVAMSAWSANLRRR